MKSLAIIFILTFLSTNSFAYVRLSCTADTYISCDTKNCNQEETSALQLDFNNNMFDIALYSITAQDTSPVLIFQGNYISFIINALNKTTSGEKVEVLATGSINISQQSFKALVNGTQYQGKCRLFY